MTIDLDDPVALMLAASAAFSRAGLKAAAYGGLAAGVYGEPRETRDADLAVESGSAETARDALAALGVQVVVTFDAVIFGGCIVSRVSLVGGGQLNTVDLVVPRSPRYSASVLARSVVGSLRGQSLRLVSAEDFILLKILSTRELDLIDARGVIEKRRPLLDEALLRDEVAQLAAEIRDHDVRGRDDVVLR